MNRKSSDDVLTLFAIGALVSVVASFTHEALGHGLGCAIDRGHITLITFLVFRCDGAHAIADGGGPVGVFVVSCLALSGIFAAGPRSPNLRLFLLTLGSLGLLWFWGQMISEAIDGSDDWGHVAAELRWSSRWHTILLVIGVVGYAAAMRVIGGIVRHYAGNPPMRLLIPYAAAVISAVLLGALWHGDRAGSALDGLLTFGVAPVGYLVVIRRAAQRTEMSAVIERNLALVVSVAVLWGTFALTVARGIGRLS